ncbi:hypothetical protein TPHA_0F00740 [Tetrapisispora phaffii CBS 4417]|uniref:Uncharacterized protein n=1 Tax=Tetrapisispora phaffii (strain ATCC 24235 / CBS 4417 / NBRC 1672 / NRRL Y-8282 / UCD 70-5) TaxID=1071381 RepID=G8BUX8_TETPH|nr:hypothetical protein TPHA_0F00740 [Tetrapisispora phaffii CBS 4417]CCE63560.1 hypothetical protein TPHA_0F00740 [Tetrapisispora phaffii CBS 4417]
MEGKSFRSNLRTAKYPDKKTKKSIFSKFKQVIEPLIDKFVRQNDNMSNGDTSIKFNRRTGETDTRSSSVNLPGSFFNPDSSYTRIIARDHQDETLINNFPDSIRDLHDEGECTIDADVSNAKLSAFFAEKGDQPLTEIEKEGILSIIKRTVGVNEKRSNFDNKSEIEGITSSRVLKSANNSMCSSPLNPPTFIPKFDNLPSPRNLSLPIYPKRRRIFDYSRTPSTYRTTVLKYSSLPSSYTVSESTLPIQEKNDFNKVNSVQKKKKKISNTASALLSLLDNQESEVNESSELANPYSAHVSKLRNYKKHQVDNQKDSAPLNIAEYKPISVGRSSKFDSYNSLKSNELTPSTSNFDRYKPARSSSLRSSVITEDIPLSKFGNESKNSDSNVPHNTLKLQSASSGFMSNPSTLKNEEKKVESNSIKTLFEMKPVVNPSLPSLSKNNDATIEHNNNENNDNLELEHADDSVIKTNNIDSGTGMEPVSIFGKPENSKVEQPFTFGKVTTFDSKVVNANSTIFQNPIATPIENKSIEEEGIKFEFGEPIASNIKLSDADELKVKKYTSMFVF